MALAIPGCWGLCHRLWAKDALLLSGPERSCILPECSPSLSRSKVGVRVTFAPAVCQGLQSFASMPQSGATEWLCASCWPLLSTILQTQARKGDFLQDRRLLNLSSQRRLFSFSFHGAELSAPSLWSSSGGCRAGKGAGKWCKVTVQVGHSHHCLSVLHNDELGQPKYRLVSSENGSSYEITQTAECECCCFPKRPWKSQSAEKQANEFGPVYLSCPGCILVPTSSPLRGYVLTPALFWKAPWQQGGRGQAVPGPCLHWAPVDWAGPRVGKADTAVCVRGELGKTGRKPVAGRLKLQRVNSAIFFYYFIFIIHFAYSVFQWCAALNSSSGPQEPEACFPSVC